MGILNYVLGYVLFLGLALFWLFAAATTWEEEKKITSIPARIIVCFYPSFIFLLGVISVFKISFFRFKDHTFFVAWLVISIYWVFVISDYPKHRPKGSKFFKIAMFLTIIVVSAKVVWLSIKHW